MKIGDKVKVKPEYGRAFSDCTGTIVATMLPDYDWAVQIDRKINGFRRFVRF
jgi:hypothetical protein